MGLPRVSGALLLAQHRIMEDLVGKPRVTAALASLPRAVREEYEGLLPVSWCDTPTALAVVTAVAREAQMLPEALKATIVRQGTRQVLGSLWKLLLRVTSDEAIIQRTPLFYSKTYDAGGMTSRKLGPGRAELLVTGWDEMPELDMVALATGIATVLEMAGRASVRVAHDRAPGGARFLASWRP